MNHLLVEQHRFRVLQKTESKWPNHRFLASVNHPWDAPRNRYGDSCAPQFSKEVLTKVLHLLSQQLNLLRIIGVDQRGNQDPRVDSSENRSMLIGLRPFKFLAIFKF